ncbi:MAG: helix-turn-helix transcriptional regulator [Desulfoarculaceae bacterium]|nr:helix-turn-helix transcriptional regulator [Desulfoarculaceae bacterium]
MYRKRRIELKIKLRTLALRCGSSIDTLRSIERGSASVKIGSWFAVAEALGLGLAEVWQGLLAETVDPFEEYDRRQGLEKQIWQTRVRS